MRAEFESGYLERADNDARILSSRVARLGDDWIWRVRLLYAEILVWRGSSDQAFNLLAEPVPESLQDRDYAPRRLMLRGLAEGHEHRYSESEKDFALAEQLVVIAHPQLVGDIYLARGSVQVDRGRYKEALRSYQIALQNARAFHRTFLEANAAGSLGYATTWLERYDESIDWFKESLAISESSGAHATSAKTLGNLGWNYHEIGDLHNALDQFQQAEKASKLAGLDLDRAYWLLSAGTVIFDLGDFRLAESNMIEALGLFQQLHDSSTISECYENLALVALQNGQFDLARQRLASAEEANSPNPDFKRAQYDKLLGAELDFRENKFDQSARLFGEILADKGSPTSMRWEAHATLAQVLAAQKKDALAENQFAAAIATISAARDAIRHEDFRLSFLSSAIRFYDQYVNFLLSQNRPLDALKIADLSRAQTLDHGLSPSAKAGAGGDKPASPKNFSTFAIHPQETARRLGATLLFYQLGQESSHLWVISPAKITLHLLPRAGEIDALVTSYRRSIVEDPRDSLESVNASGQKLYEMLIQPVANAIPKGSRAIILPDGPLRSLNFESLPVYGPNPHYWIEDATVSVAGSLSLLSRVSNNRPPKSPNLLFFGDPDPPAKEFPRLGDAGEEVRAVQSHFDEKSTTLFLKNDARPSVYLSSDPGKYSYVHFATHGIASVTKPLESAIILTREGDSYKLYARDILQHPLNAYLVSISACDGSGKRNFAGEGLIGLSWAFLRAGAHNVVAGLWETSTASTPPIFDRLYQGVAHGEDPATALRNAKLALVHAKGASRRPFYWAPFQLYVGS